MVTKCKERFKIGLSSAETDQWLALFKLSEKMRSAGVVDYELVEAQNSRVLTTQICIPLKEGSTQKEAWAVKTAVDSWLQTTPEMQIHGHSLRYVMEAPPSMEARRRAGGRAYGILGNMLQKVRQVRPVLAEATIYLQWGAPLDVCVRGLAGGGRALCIATWQGGDWTARGDAIEAAFGEELRPNEILAALRG